MACDTVILPDGGRAIVCSGRRRRKQCACGRPATQQCDWKVPGRRSGTCDADLCERCSTVPAPDKDLCPEHAAAWRSWRSKRDPGSARSRKAERPSPGQGGSQAGRMAGARRLRARQT